MFFKKKKKIKELEKIIEILDERIEIQNNILRTTLEREKQLTRIKNRQEIQLKEYQKLVIKYQNERK